MPTPKKKETYSQAMERLEKIVRQIDNNELEIDALAEKIKEIKPVDQKAIEIAKKRWDSWLRIKTTRPSVTV